MRRERGFTLVEVMVALSLGALVLFAAHRVFSAVVDGSHRLTEAQQALERQSNTRRWLTEAFGSLAIGETGGGFAGHVDRVQFSTWELDEHGWRRRDRVELELRQHQFIASTEAGDITLADSLTALEFDYLLDPSDGSGSEGWGFVREWISPVSAPLAVRVRLAYKSQPTDTLFLIVGPRG